MTGPNNRNVIDIALVKQACGNCNLHQLCLPMGVELEDVDRLDTIVKRRRPLPRGSYVFHLGDDFHSLYAIRSGSVKTYTITEDGSEQITGFHLPGELIGLDAINTSRHPCGARSLETTSICEIPFSRLEELSIAVPGLGRQLLRVMSREIHADGELLTLLGKKSAEERLAALLLSLSMRFQARGFSPREFHLSMSRHDIGNYLGLAVETVSRLFTRFQQQGLIEVRNKYIQLKEMEQLQTLAGLSNQLQNPQIRVK
ncbi:MAG: fumarate/nitrate reduction transcriptional regulator Fnr [Candidatus Competibacteraceae bacterium]|jgi:CRP/FNR family transcriptional regulator|nr:fumarate/nitrate reduction transcriptional regulator Fnr [Candidatus Competibacteraceae bacterium]